MNDNDKQIGRNIKAIRNANGMNTLDFASYKNRRQGRRNFQ